MQGGRNVASQVYLDLYASRGLLLGHACAMAPQRGLSREDAEHTSMVLNSIG